MAAAGWPQVPSRAQTPGLSNWGPAVAIGKTVRAFYGPARAVDRPSGPGPAGRLVGARSDRDKDSDKLQGPSPYLSLCARAHRAQPLQPCSSRGPRRQRQWQRHPPTAASAAAVGGSVSQGLPQRRARLPGTAAAATAISGARLLRAPPRPQDSDSRGGQCGSPQASDTSIIMIVHCEVKASGWHSRFRRPEEAEPAAVERTIEGSPLSESPERSRLGQRGGAVRVARL